jgi:hypothetical protein
MNGTKGRRHAVPPFSLCMVRSHLVHACMRKAMFLLIAFGMLWPLGAFAQDSQRTEEYALLSAWQQGRRTFISVQVGSETTPNKEFDAEKGGKPFDLSPVIREMEALNAMGFELVTGNSSMIPVAGTTTGPSGLPFYTFVFKRRIQ